MKMKEERFTIAIMFYARCPSTMLTFSIENCFFFSSFLSNDKSSLSVIHCDNETWWMMGIWNLMETKNLPHVRSPSTILRSTAQKNKKKKKTITTLNFMLMSTSRSIAYRVVKLWRSRGLTPPNVFNVRAHHIIAASSNNLAIVRFVLNVLSLYFWQKNY